MPDLYKFPTDDSLFTAMWAQFSGLADCCGGGVIGRISGVKMTQTAVSHADAEILGYPHKPFKNMAEYIEKVLPNNRLFAGPAKYLYWAVLEQMMLKANEGHCLDRLKADSVEEGIFDFEYNARHDWWAGDGFNVQMWVTADKTNGTYMGHPADLRVNTFLDFVEEHDLCTTTRSHECPSSYGNNTLQITVLNPNLPKIMIGLEATIAEANKMCAERWAIVKDEAEKHPAIKDKVAQTW